MDKEITGRFERLEKALSNLIDSIAKYHPSIIQAEELRAADDELNKGLEQVEKHQNNHLRLLELRQTSSSLDTQIRETLQSLSNTRKDIVTTQTTTYPTGPGYPIVYEELLRYARRISKTTMPPAGTINSAPTAAAASPTDGQTPGAQTPGAQTPGTDAQTPGASGTQTATTPAGQTPSQITSPIAINGGAAASSLPETQQQPSASQRSTNAPTLPENLASYLNPLSGRLFFPWPAEDKIRSGSLASNQILIERGIDPRGYDPAAEEEQKKRAEEEKKEMEEREKAEREAEERRVREERDKLRREREKAEEERKKSVAQGGGSAPGGAASVSGTSPVTAGPGKKQFQFANLDDLDEDDDD